MKKNRRTSKPKNRDEALLWAKKEYPEWADDIVLCPEEQSKADDEMKTQALGYFALLILIFFGLIVYSCSKIFS